eukprot:2965389-Rhodomonas_salina.2
MFTRPLSADRAPCEVDCQCQMRGKHRSCHTELVRVERRGHMRIEGNEHGPLEAEHRDLVVQHGAGSVLSGA